MSLKKKNITIRDIAKMADVSYQTVSLVINDKPGVSEKTRKRIQRLMSDLDYHPNKAAQMLTTSRSKTLELIIVDIVYAGRMAESTQTMANVAKQAGYSLLVSETTSEELADSLDSAASRMVEGIVMYAPRLRMPDSTINKLLNGIPLVRRDYVPGSQIAWVGFDQVYATRLAVEHLIELGHRQIAMIAPEQDLLNGYWRRTAFIEALREHGLEPGPIAEGDYSMRSGYLGAYQLIDSEQQFTAILAGTDHMATGALRALRERGLRVPEDVSVISYDNSEICLYTTPSLTTIDFKFATQDEIAVKYLLEIIDNPETERHQRVFLSNLIVRESTRRLK